MSTEIKQMLDLLPSVAIELENSEQLTEMTWYSYLESNDGLKVVYIFRVKDRELLIAKNGKVLTGTWDFITNTNSVLIDFGGNRTLYNAVLLQGHYFVLKQDGLNEPLLLINQAYFQRLIEINPTGIASFLTKELKKLVPEPEAPELTIPSIEPEVLEPEVNSLVLDEEMEEDTELEEPKVEEKAEINEYEPIEEVEDALTIEEVNETNEETEQKPVSILERFRQDQSAEENDLDDEVVYPFGEKKASLNDKLKEQLHKAKQPTLLDKLAGKVKKD